MWPFGGEEEGSGPSPDAKGSGTVEQTESWVPDLGIESTIGWMMGSPVKESSPEVAEVQAELDAILKKQIHFHGGKSEIADGSVSTVQAIADVLLREPGMRVIIEGHTDSNNQPLSQKRAEEVATCLRQLGVDSARVESRGFGNRYPLPTGNSKRVEIKVIGSPSANPTISGSPVKEKKPPVLEERPNPQPANTPDLTVVLDSFHWESYVFYHTTELAPPKAIAITIPTDRVRLVEVIIKSCRKSYLVDIPAGCGGSKIEAHFRKSSAAEDFSLVFSSKLGHAETWKVSPSPKSAPSTKAKYKSITVTDINAYLLPIKESAQTKSTSTRINESYLKYVVQAEPLISEQKSPLEKKQDLPLPLTDPEQLPAVQEVLEEAKETVPKMQDPVPVSTQPTKPLPVVSEIPGPSLIRCALAAGLLVTVGFGAYYFGQQLRLKSAPI